MARIDELQKGLAKSSSLGSNLQLGRFNNPIGFTPPQPRSMFGASAQRSSQDFSRLQMPQTPSIPLGNTIPVFPDNYNQAMGERMRAPSPIVSGIRDGNVSGFSPYSPMVPSMGGLTQAPPMAPTTDTISSFGNPLASRTIRVSGPAGYGSTTLTPEQQTARFRENQRAEQMGPVNTASSRTPAQQQALLAQMRTAGQRIASTEKERQTELNRELTRGYYGFVQGLESEKALRAAGQAAAEQARGGSGRDAIRRQEQAKVRAEIAKQAGQLVGIKDQRAPFFSWEPVTLPTGEQFYRGRMGEYTQVPSVSRPVAQQSSQTTPSSFWQTAMLGRPQASVAPSPATMPTGSISDYTPFSSRTQSAAMDSIDRFRSAVGPSRISQRERTVMPVPITSRV